MSRTLQTDPSLSVRLHQKDRSFFYTQLCVGFHPLSISQHVSDSTNFLLNDPRISLSPFSIATPTSNWLNAQDLTSGTFENAVAYLEKVFDFSHHPYFVWLMSASSERGDFYQSQLPFRFAVEMWSQAVAGVLSKAETLEKRYKIFENLSEEHGHMDFSKSHKFTFLEFLDALGGDPEDYQNSDIPIHVLIFSRSLIDFCGTHHFTAGSAALGMIETLYCQISEIITNSIFGKGWVKKGEQHHYEFHAEIDIEHGLKLFYFLKLFLF